MDTLGHTSGGTVGLFECHGAGGNQVSGYLTYKACIFDVLRLIHVVIVESNWVADVNCLKRLQGLCLPVCINHQKWILTGRNMQLNKSSKCETNWICRRAHSLSQTRESWWYWLKFFTEQLWNFVKNKMLKHDSFCLETANEKEGTPALLRECDEQNSNQV